MPEPLCAVDGCTNQPFTIHPLPLCQRDALMVSLNVTDLLHANAMTPTGGSSDIEKATTASDTAWTMPSHPPLVYFLSNGQRIKIGTSTNITARVGALSLRRSNAELLLNGDHKLENSLHQHFAADRIGKTEWFTFSPRIQDYIGRRKAADIALRQPVLPPETPARAVITIRSTAKAASADEKIVQLLSRQTAPGRVVYLHKDVIGQHTSLVASTLDNTLSRLVKAGKIHRQREGGKTIRGMYGPGPTPDGQEDADDTA